MSVKIGLLFAILLAFLTGAREAAAQSGVSAQIRATATVVVPVGFYDDLPESSGDDAVGGNLTVINLCYPKQAGILVDIGNDRGIIKQYRFPAKTWDDPSGGISTVHLNSIILEKAVLFHDGNALRGSCFITLIYSEN